MKARKLNGALERGRAAAEAHEEALAQAYERALRQVGRFAARRFSAAATPHLTASAPTSASMMLAVYPTPEQAQELAQPNGEPAEILHVTLAFLGDVDPDQAEQAAAVAREVAAAFPEPELEGVVGGIAAFGSETGMLAELARVAGLVAPEGGYGTTLWNGETATVLWIPADWTTTEEQEAAAAAFFAVPGVEAVEVPESESAAPAGEEWEPVWANGRALVEAVYPSIILPDVPGLAELRQAVCEALTAAGIPYVENHGWTPHLTIAYVGEPLPPPASLLGLPLTFANLSATQGDVARDFPLGAPAALTAAGPPDWSPPHGDEVVDPDEVIGRLRTKSDRVRRAAIKAAASPALDAAGLDWDVSNPFVKGVLEKTGAEIVGIGETTRLNVLRIIDKAYEEGLSIPDTAKAIREGMDAAAGSRAVVIARTEMASLANGGWLAASQIVAEETGIPYWSRWLTAPGAEYPRHEDYDGLDGQTVPLGELFEVGAAKLAYPADPDGPPEETIQCRCSLVMVESPDGSAAPADDPNAELDGALDSEGLTRESAGIVDVISSDEAAGALTADRLSGAATVGEEKGTLESWHVTDDPARVEKRLAEGKPLTSGRDTGKVGDLATSGLYVSARPRVWLGRSDVRFQFLADMDAETRRRFADEVRGELEAQEKAGYITPHEVDLGKQALSSFEVDQEFLNNAALLGIKPGIESMGSLEGQPFNMKLTEIARKIGISVGDQPVEVPVVLHGRFAKIRPDPSPATIRALKAAGFDGAYVDESMTFAPQMVVWNNDAVLRFGDFARTRVRELPTPPPTEVSTLVAPKNPIPDQQLVPTVLTPAQLKSSSNDELWDAMAENGKLDNLAEADIAKEAEDQIAAELWARGEVGLPPNTLRSADIAGEGQLHTLYSDGHDTAEQMALEAMKHGQTQITVTDHAHMVSPAMLQKEWSEIDALNEKYAGRFKILKGIEANILPDGTLDVADDVLKQADVVIAALHAEPGFDTTARFLKVMDNPNVTVIGHAHSVAADWDVVAAKAAEKGIGLEVNGRDMLRKSTRPEAEKMIAAALKARAPIAIGSDAHRAGNLVDSLYAIRVAAENGVTRDDLLAYLRRPGPGGVPIGDNLSVPTAPFVPTNLVQHVDKLGLNVYPAEKGPVSRSIFGAKDTTEQLYETSNGRWQVERATLHDDIFSKHFRGKTPPAPSDRHALFTAGGTASGKGKATFRLDGKQLTLNELRARPDFIVVDSDAIKEMLPEYQEMENAGEVYAAAGVHDESSAIARTIVEAARARGFSVVLDSTGAGGSFLAKLEEFAASKYDVQVGLVSIPTNEAIVRMVGRGQETGRYVSVPILKSAHRDSAANFLLWRDSDSVPNWQLFDNSAKDIELVAERKNGKITIYDQAKYDDTLAKANEPAVSFEMPDVKPTSEAKMVTLPDGRVVLDNISVPGQPPVQPLTLQKALDYRVVTESEIVRGKVADEILGKASDSEELYRDPETGKYPESREKMYAKIVGDLLEGHEPRIGRLVGAPVKGDADAIASGEAFAIYSRSGYVAINDVLRGEKGRALIRYSWETPATPGAEVTIGDVVARMDKTMAENPLAAEKTVWRGIDPLERVYGVSDPADLVGREFADAGFASTSTDRAKAAKFGEPNPDAARSGLTGALIRLRVPPGVGAFYRGGVEKEMILDRGLTIKFDSFENGVLEAHVVRPGEPEILFTAGGGASGKSLGLRVNPELKPVDAVEVNPDVTMTKLPEWKRFWDADEPIAAAALHEEGSYVAKDLLDQALAGHYNVLMDVVGDEEPGKFAEKIREVKRLHPEYHIRLLMADAPTNVAIDRNIGRASDREHVDYGRFVPIDVQKFQHRAAIERIADWWMMPEIEEWEIYRTENVPGSLVARGGAGRTPVIVDPVQWQSMMQKVVEESPGVAPPAFTTTTVLTSPEDAARAAAAGIRESVARGETPPPDEGAKAFAQAEKNFAKLFRGRVVDDPKAIAAVEAAARYNAGSELVRAAQAEHGAESVVVISHSDTPSLIDPGGDFTAAGRLTGNRLTIVREEALDGSEFPALPDGPIEAGDTSTATHGGIPALLRHEYGHQLEETLTASQKGEFRQLLPSSSQVERRLTKYAAKGLNAGNAQEAFSEVYAIAADPNYNPDAWAPWIQKAVSYVGEVARAEVPTFGEVDLEQYPFANSLGHLIGVTKEDLLAGKVPGIKYDPDISPHLAGHAYDKEITVGPAAFNDDGTLDTLIVTHEAGHSVASQILFEADGAVPDILKPVQLGKDVGGRFDNPFGFSEKPQEVLSDAYSALLHNFRATIEDPEEGLGLTESKILDEVAAIAKKLGLPSEPLYRRPANYSSKMGNVWVRIK